MTRGQGAQEPTTQPEQRETVELTAEPHAPLEVSPGVTVTLNRDHPTQITVERPAVARPE